MAVEDLWIGGASVAPRRAVQSANFDCKKVLTADVWSYVDLWLKRRGSAGDAAFYWEQAREFAETAADLPDTAAPLPLYYAFMNITKALLAVRGSPYGPHHGLSGKSIQRRSSLANEIINIKRGGVLPALIRYYGETESARQYDLKTLLYNLPFVHRAYSLTYKEKEIFLSLDEPTYVRKYGSSEAWLMAYVDGRHDNKRIMSTLPPGYQVDHGFADKLVVRRKKRFRWQRKRTAGSKAKNLSSLQNYHTKTRRDLVYIANVHRWYLKRRLSTATIVDRHVPVITLMAMHRLSELSGYDPLKLSKILGTQRGWLISEFISAAPIQFLDEMACEITGEEISSPMILALGRA